MNEQGAPPARGRSVTIRHVAADAGVSLQTVSRVINDGPNVRPIIKARVQEAIDRLGYVPSLAARRMRGTRSYLLLALNDRDRTIQGWQSGDGTDWVDQMLLGGMLRSAEHGYRMVFELVDTHSAHVEKEISAALAALHPDGVILTPPHGDNPLITELLTDKNIPFARIGSTAEGAGFAISMDDRRAAVVATEHLLSLGHRRVGFITGSEEYRLSADRLEGFTSCMASARISDWQELIANGDFTFQSGADATRQLLALKHPPTAIIGSSDQMALATLHVARLQRLSVPRELSVISFDDTPIVKFSTPKLTAIRQPIAAMTARAVDLLIRAIHGEVDDGASHVLPFDLVNRESTAPPPLELIPSSG